MKYSARKPQPRHIGNSKQKGFSLAELSLYIAIVIILSVAAIAGYKAFVISGRVSTMATELQRIGQRLTLNADGMGATPYTTLTTDEVCNIARGGAIITSAGTGNGTTCTHSLVAFGSGNVSATPGTVINAGDAWTIQVDNVSSFACPDLGATMNRSVVVISINGTVVKPANGTFNAAAAAAACTLLDTNQFQFTGA